jgi:glycosyltransferase involved in cell wall biosynthesis
MEQQLERLVIELLDAGRRVTLLARSCTIARSDNVQLRGALRFVRVRGPARPFVIAFPIFFVGATWLLRQNRGRIVHTTGALVGSRADLSTIHYCHAGAARRYRGARVKRDTALYRANATVAAWMARSAERWCYRPCQTRHLCAVSSGLAQELRECFPRVADSITVIANGVDIEVYRPDAAARADTRRTLGIGSYTPVALFAGGDWDRKGLHHVVAAVARRSCWHLIVAGDGDHEALMADAASAGCAHRIHHLGRVQDMAPVYAACDAFVLPTAYESFSLVSYEAAASGLPLLATRVSGIEDLVTHGVNGWFISRNSESIERHLAMLESSAGLRHDMSKAARAAAAAFSWQAMKEGYHGLYADLGLATVGNVRGS